MEALLNLNVLAKIKIDRDELVRVLARLKGIVERKNTIAILGNVLIETLGNNQIKLSATDMDIMATEIIGADVAAQGRVTIPAHVFHDTVKALDADTVEIYQEETKEGAIIAKVVSGKYRATLPSLATDNFPVLELGEELTKFSITSENLRRLINKTLFAVSNEEMRYYLNGIYLHQNQNKLLAASTDMHRLAEYAVDLQDASQALPSIIIPRKTVAELLNFLDKVNAEILVKISKTKISFEFNNTYVVSKLIDGKYPDYRAVIPTSNKFTAIVSKAILQKSINIVSIFASQNTKTIKFEFTDKSLILSTNSENNSTAQEELELEYVAQAPTENLAIYFNYRYLNDVLSVLEGDKVELNFTESFAAFLIGNAEDKAGRFVVMPTRE